jgi:beta-N-acetylhexosaminidase
LSDDTGERLPRPIVFGCAGPSLNSAERGFFETAEPLGFALFARNCRDPAQVRDLIAALRDCVGRRDAPILIDQEGGRVARLRPPHWRPYPAAAEIAALPDPEAEEAARLGARLIADDLAALGIAVDCAPVLDLPTADADRVIGDRAYGSDPDRVVRLGRAVCEGLLAGGVLPVLKHIPGHGRARVDSHRECPLVDAEFAALAAGDFAPFRALSAMPWAMTAHIIYTAIDDAAPATLSRRVIDTVIRGEIGFDGVLISDDICMGALRGGSGSAIGRIAAEALAAGCDIVLHCNGDLRDMDDVAEAASPMTPRARARLARAEALRQSSRHDFDRESAAARFAALLGGGGA